MLVLAAAIVAIVAAALVAEEVWEPTGGNCTGRECCACPPFQSVEASTSESAADTAGIVVAAAEWRRAAEEAVAEW